MTSPAIKEPTNLPYLSTLGFNHCNKLTQGRVRVRVGVVENRICELDNIISFLHDVLQVFGENLVSSSQFLQCKFSVF